MGRVLIFENNTTKTRIVMPYSTWVKVNGGISVRNGSKRLFVSQKNFTLVEVRYGQS